MTPGYFPIKYVIQKVPFEMDGDIATFTTEVPFGTDIIGWVHEEMKRTCPEFNFNKHVSIIAEELHKPHPDLYVEVWLTKKDGTVISKTYGLCNGMSGWLYNGNYLRNIIYDALYALHDKEINRDTLLRGEYYKGQVQVFVQTKNKEVSAPQTSLVAIPVEVRDIPEDLDKMLDEICQHIKKHEAEGDFIRGVYHKGLPATPNLLDTALANMRYKKTEETALELVRIALASYYWFKNSYTPALTKPK